MFDWARAVKVGGIISLILVVAYLFLGSLFLASKGVFDEAGFSIIKNVGMIFIPIGVIGLFIMAGITPETNNSPR